MKQRRLGLYLGSTAGALAVLGALALPAAVHADEPAAAAAPTAPPPTAPALTTYAAENLLGMEPALDRLGIKVSGWVEQSYTYNFHNTLDNFNNARVFDNTDGYLLNQVGLNIERDVTADPKKFDLGGRIEALYGNDASLIHSAYLFGPTDSQWQGDDRQFDPEQFYVQAHLPVGNGLNVTVGKFDTTLGYEVIDAPGNPLFSHSYLFGYAIPFTHTGIRFDYPVNDNVSVYYGLVFGWDTFANSNDAPTNMIGGSWKINDKLTWLTNLIVGPEQPKSIPGDHSAYRTVWDNTLTYQVSDSLLLALNGDWGNETLPSDTKAGNNWYGAAGYITYTFNDQISTTLRIEGFRDETGTRIGNIVPASVGQPASLFEVTYGFTIKPIRQFGNLIVRPEFRYDHSFNQPVFDNNNPSRDQYTLACDVIITF